MEDVVLTGTRENAYDTSRVYDRRPISRLSSGSLPPSFFRLSMRYRTVLSRAQVVKDPHARVFTRDYFWRPNGRRALCAGADVTHTHLSICRAASTCVTFTITPSSRRFSCFSPPRADPMHNVSSSGAYCTRATYA